MQSHNMCLPKHETPKCKYLGIHYSSCSPTAVLCSAMSILNVMSQARMLGPRCTERQDLPRTNLAQDKPKSVNTNVMIPLVNVIIVVVVIVVVILVAIIICIMIIIIITIYDCEHYYYLAVQ